MKGEKRQLERGRTLQSRLCLSLSIPGVISIMLLMVKVPIHAVMHISLYHTIDLITGTKDEYSDDNDNN